ncbi:MAG: hypothetical protein KGS72_20030 [Cyanobacteria bacterium REEB67]|nr:hypothetical protein [Cyanobacteria bacterium REEB67]
MTWTTPVDIKAQIQKLWDNGDILGSIARNENVFPRRLKLKCPTTQEYTNRFDETRKWADNLNSIKQCRIEYEEINHRVLGKNNFPKQIWIDDLEQAASLIGKRTDLAQFRKLIETINQRQPLLIPWFARRPMLGLELDDRLPQLLAIVESLMQRPRPGIYLRQLSIEGVHSKFIENNRGVLSEWLDILLKPETIEDGARGVGQFNRRYGFRDKSQRVRFRILDKSLNLLKGDNDQDISVDIECFDGLDPPIKTVFITENEVNYLAFTTLPGSMVIFGAGYGLGFLSHATWLQKCRVFYWGDIDTHGLAILNSARAHFPQLKSILMDKATLMAHKHFWSTEPRQHLAQDLNNLDADESALFSDLKEQVAGNNVRLEQEFINWDYAWTIIQSCASKSDAI